MRSAEVPELPELTSGRLWAPPHALGLYVVARIDAKLAQMNSAIVAERRLHQLRIASIEALLTLAEMMERFDVSHDEVLAVLRPGGPLVDDQARLLAASPPSGTIRQPPTTRYRQRRSRPRAPSSTC